MRSDRNISSALTPKSTHFVRSSLSSARSWVIRLPPPVVAAVAPESAPSDAEPLADSLLSFEEEPRPKNEDAAEAIDVADATASDVAGASSVAPVCGATGKSDFTFRETCSTRTLTSPRSRARIRGVSCYETRIGTTDDPAVVIVV